MNMLTLLLARLLAGERYEPASKRDTRIWVSLLAAFPFPLAAGILAAPYTRNESLILVWLEGVAEMLLLLLIWRGFFRTFQLPTLSVLAVVGWVAAVAAVFSIP